MRSKTTEIIRTRELQPAHAFTASRAPLTTTARVYGGPGIGIAEIQATIEPPDTAKGRILAVGVPRSEVQQVLSTALKIPSLVGRPDYDVTTRLVGADKYQSSFGLGVTLAIVASYLRKPIPDHYVFMGEIDLHRDVRGGTPRIIENLRRSIDSVEVDPEMTLVLPSALRAGSLAQLGVRLIPCVTLVDVIGETWQVARR